MAKLTHQQKLDALAYRFYQGAAWEPKAGDFYTTSRADLELYQVVSVEGGVVRTRFTEGSDAIAEWPEGEFLTGGFGPKRVFVPEWVICANQPVEQQLSGDILAELVRARTKFPGKNATFAALVEEVGELATATFEEGRERVRKEAVQVAVMAMRMVLDGDHTFDDWRATKGLDALVAPEANGGPDHG
ncbi:UNVERIFIED_ORG: hypothetical protein LHK14_00375 [Roseateles sp. XES5]|nr:hypothetical protein [Roseateles sp. XES5]